MIATSDLVQLVGFLAWPVAAVMLMVVFVRSNAGSRFLAGVADRVSHVKGLGIEFDLEPTNAGQVKVDLETEFSEYRDLIRKRFDALNHEYDIIRLRDRLVEEVMLPALTSDDVDIRCTIYVPDILFADALYRLTDYYPTGGESGKIYSIRFGIIGRQWRLGESIYESDVTTDRQLLMKDWGMTKGEANAKGTDRSFLVTMLRYDGVEQGLVLVSSTKVSPFKNGDISDQVDNHVRTSTLAEHIARVNGEMRKRGPALKLFDE